MIALKPGADHVVGAGGAVEPVALKPGIRQVGEEIEVYEAEGAELSPFLQARLEDINTEYRSFISVMKKGLPHAVRIGHALRAMKADLGHGNWIPFVEAYLPFTRQAAREWMTLSEEVEAGKLDMETVDSISQARQLRAASKKVPCPSCGRKVSPEKFKRGLSADVAEQSGKCGACGSEVIEAKPMPKPYVIDTERQRQHAEKARERFIKVMGHLTTLGNEVHQGKAPGEILHLDRVVAVEDPAHLREWLRDLDSGIAAQRQLRRELAELLEAI